MLKFQFLQQQLMLENFRNAEEGIQKSTLITKKLKNGQSLNRTQALYEEVIEKNFQIINQLLQKLHIVFTRHQEFQNQFTVYSKRLGKIEADIETIHNEHRRNNLQISSSIEDMKYEINGIDSHIKLIYQEYRKKGLNTQNKSNNNFNLINTEISSQSCLSNLDEEFEPNMQNFATVSDKDNKQASQQASIMKIQTEESQKTKNQCKQIKSKKMINQSSNFIEGKEAGSKRKIKKQKKQVFRKSLGNTIENGKLLGKKQQQNKKGSIQNLRSARTKHLIQEQNQNFPILREQRLKRKCLQSCSNDLKENESNQNKIYSQVSWNIDHNLIFQADQVIMNKNKQLSKLGKMNLARFNSEGKKIGNQHNSININFGDNQSNQLESNEQYLYKEDLQSIKVQIFRNVGNELEKLRAYIFQVETKLAQTNYKCTFYVPTQKHSQDVFGIFNQLKNLRSFCLQSFANKTQTKQALLFMENKLKNALKFTAFDNILSGNQSTAQSSTPNATNKPTNDHNVESQCSTIISKCLGCNRWASLMQDTPKVYSLTPFNEGMQQKKVNIWESNIKQLKKRTMSLLKVDKNKGKTFYRHDKK